MIQDAPYIVEAEQIGIPTDDDFPIQYVESKFSQADYLIGQAVLKLCDAAEEAEKYGKEAPIDEFIQKLDDDIRYEMRQIVNRLKND